jgi:hypothetical protein
VRAGALMRDGVRQGRAGASTRAAVADNVVRMPRARTWRSSTILPWAVAATLAVIVGYQSQSSRKPDGRLAGGIVALSPTTLRPATRGREQVVAAGLASALAIDVAELGSDGPLHYSLLTAEGTNIAAGEVPPPAAGAPLLLLLPSNLLKPSGHYTLRLENPRNPALTPEDYRFTVSER